MGPDSRVGVGLKGPLPGGPPQFPTRSCLWKNRFSFKETFSSFGVYRSRDLDLRGGGEYRSIPSEDVGAKARLFGSFPAC